MRLTDYKTPMAETLRQPQVWLSVLLFFLYVGAESSLGTWTYTLDQSAVQDLDAVRAALGFERMILFGTSGGTRQSLKYLKRYPRRVDAMILSGTVPLTFRMPMHYAPDAQAAFERACEMYKKED